VVYVSGIIGVLLEYQHFTLVQLIIALLTFPITVTLAEAFAPHTFDTPFIFGIGGAVIYIITQLPL
jgi:hypothetical protein